MNEELKETLWDVAGFTVAWVLAVVLLRAILGA